MTVILRKSPRKSPLKLRQALSYYRLASKAEKHHDAVSAKKYRKMADQLMAIYRESAVGKRVASRRYA